MWTLWEKMNGYCYMHTVPCWEDNDQDGGDEVVEEGPDPQDGGAGNVVLPVVNVEPHVDDENGDAVDQGDQDHREHQPQPAAVVLKVAHVTEDQDD